MVEVSYQNVWTDAEKAYCRSKSRVLGDSKKTFEALRFKHMSTMVEIKG